MKIEITKGVETPVTKFFSNTPETDAAIKDQAKWMRPFVSTTLDGITYDSPVASLCRKLERERDEWRKKFELSVDAVEIAARLARAESERDEAREALRELWQTADAYIPQIDEEQTTKWHSAMFGNSKNG
jgi:hypothetical protein